MDNAMLMVIMLNEDKTSPFCGLITDLPINSETPKHLEPEPYSLTSYSGEYPADIMRVAMKPCLKALSDNFFIHQPENQIKILINYLIVLERRMGITFSDAAQTLITSKTNKSAYINAVVEVLIEDLLLRCYADKDFTRGSFAALLNKRKINIDCVLKTPAYKTNLTKLKVQIKYKLKQLITPPPKISYNF